MIDPATAIAGLLLFACVILGAISIDRCRIHLGRLVAEQRRTNDHLAKLLDAIRRQRDPTAPPWD